MKSIIAIGIAIAFLFLPGCPKEVKKDDPKLEEPKNGEETPAWSKFPLPDEEKEDKEEKEDE